MDELKKVHDFLDDYNAEQSDAFTFCVFCKSRQYNATDGIVHDDNCVIIKLRRLLQSLTTEDGVMTPEAICKVICADYTCAWYGADDIRFCSFMEWGKKLTALTKLQCDKEWQEKLFHMKENNLLTADEDTWIELFKSLKEGE